MNKVGEIKFRASIDCAGYCGKYIEQEGMTYSGFTHYLRLERGWRDNRKGEWFCPECWKIEKESSDLGR